MRLGSVGLPAPHTILEVVDLETGERLLPIGEKGEICFRGPQVMKGYWKKPEATEEAFRGGPIPHRRYWLPRPGRLRHVSRPQEGHDDLFKEYFYHGLMLRRSDVGVVRRVTSVACCVAISCCNS